MEGQDEVPGVPLPQDWSELPTEVLGVILSNLHRKSDLLRSRLVCRSWNEECLIVMKKPESGFHQTLTDCKINQYIDFASNGDCVPEVCRLIPFHLDINLCTDETRLNNLKENIEVLCFTFGKECITKITLRSTTPVLPFVKSWLIDFLVNISPNVKILSLSDFSLRIVLYRDDEMKKTDIWSVQFPKLKSLTCRGNRSRGIDRNYWTRHSIHQYIIQRSPNLENLEEIRTQDLPIKYDKLRTLTFGKTVKDPSRILEILRLSSNVPQIHTFGFSLNHFFEARQIPMFHNLLEFFSSTLKSLTITTTGEYLAVNKIGTRRSGLLTFPDLPNLQHLRLNMDTQVNNNKLEVTTTTEDLICYDPEEKNFTPEYLPSLKSVEVPLGFMLSAKSGTFSIFSFLKLKMENNPDPPVNFPNVRDLTIRMSHTRLSLWVSYIGVPLKHLQKVFPNVSKLSIIYEYSDKDISHPSTYGFPNLHNLTATAKCFPALQILEISKFLFREMTDIQREELLNALASTFPYLLVYVIDE